MNKENIAKRRETLDQDFQTACAAVGTNDILIRGPLVTASVILKRRRVALFLRQRGHTIEDIGGVINRHHSSVLNLIKKAGDEYFSEEAVIKRRIKWLTAPAPFNPKARK